MKFYAGFPVTAPSSLHGTHITTMFSELVPTKRLHASDSPDDMHHRITGVEYWHLADVTVLIVESDLCIMAYEYWAEQGFKYDYVYRPHITVSKGDTRLENERYINTYVTLGDEFFRLFERG